ncbi:MAG: DNA polymerase III subunit beta, partial [Lachnospiraceae bacterium]|nr:DNA polymerase III subunit beta [Lachnospiraceae bacterium]
MMTGILVEINGNHLKMVALDGHRISIRVIELKDSYENRKVIVPGKTLNEISKIINGSIEDMMEIYITENHIIFEFENTTMVSRLIDGEYFRYEQMMKSDYETRVRVNKRELMDSIARATLLVKEGDKKPIIMNIEDQNMELTSNSFIGSMKEDRTVEKEGKDIMIGFNPKFFMDALRVVDDEEVNLYMLNPKAPCFIKNEQETYIYIILPVNFSSVK